MGQPTGNVNFFGSPFAVMNPDVAVQQEQIERQQQLVDAMRQQAMTPVLRPSEGGAVWSQGLAKLAQALFARSDQKKVDQRTIALGQAIRGRMTGQTQPGVPQMPGSIGGYGGGTFDTNMNPVTARDPLSGGSIPAKGGDPQSPPDMGIGSLSNHQALINAMSDQNAPSAPVPQSPAPPSPGAGQTPPPQSSPAAGASSGTYPDGLPILSGDYTRDHMQSAFGGDTYWSGLNAQIAPTDLQKLITARAQAAAHGDWDTVNAISAKLTHDNYLAPINVRANGVALDPVTHQPIFQAGTAPPGTAIDYANGKPAGMHLLPGAPEALGGAAGAEAAGKAAGQMPYEPVTVTDAQGNTYTVPKSSLPGFGVHGGAPGAPPAGGSLNGYYGRQGGAPGAAPGPVPGAAPGGGIPAGPGGIGAQTGIGPGPQAANTEAGKNSADGFNAAIQGGVDAKNAIQTINSIMEAGKGLPTGQGSGAISGVKSAVNAVVGAAGGGPVFDRDQIAKFDEMKKNTAILGQQLASAAAGSNGVTDAKLSNALNAVPGAHYSPQAIQVVGSRLRGLQAAAAGRSQAAAAWQQAHGANSYPAFQSAWQSAYNPDVFEHMQRGPADFGAWIHSMHPADAARTMGQYRQMKALGAF